MKNIFLDLLEINIALSPVIAILCLFGERLRKRYGALWMKAVWILLTVRLLIPYNFSLPFAENMILKSMPDSIQDAGGMQTAYLVHEAYVLANRNDLNVMEQTDGSDAKKSGNMKTGGQTEKSEVEEIYEADIEENLIKGNMISGSTMNEYNIDEHNINEQTANGERLNNMIFYSDVLVKIWILGICLVSLYLLVSYLILKNQCKRNRKPVAGKELERNITEVQKKFMGKASIPVYQSMDVKSPMLMGFLEPELFLPVFYKAWTEKEIEMMIEHELCHYKKKDLFWKLLMSAVWCVNWFNPLVLLMKKQFFYDMELTCDGIVLLERSAEDREIYARMMLSFAGSRKDIPEFSTGFGEDKKRMKKRIDYMLDEKKRKKGILGIAVTGICVLSFGLLVSCGNDVKEEQETDFSATHTESMEGGSLPENTDSEGSVAIPEEPEIAETAVFDYNHEYNKIIRCHKGDVYLEKSDGIYRLKGGEGKLELLYANEYGRLRRGMELYEDYLYFCGSVSVGEEKKSTIYRISLDTFEVEDMLEDFERDYEELFDISIYEGNMYVAGGWGQRIGFELNSDGKPVKQLDDTAQDFLYREYNDYITLEEQIWNTEYDTEEYWELKEEKKEKYLAVIDVAACKKMLHGNHVVVGYKDEAMYRIYLETEDGAYVYLCDVSDVPVVTETGIYYSTEETGNVWYMDFETKTPSLLYERDPSETGWIELLNYDADYFYVLHCRYVGWDGETAVKVERELERIPRNGGEDQSVYSFGVGDDFNEGYGLNNSGIYNGTMYFAAHEPVDIDPDRSGAKQEEEGFDVSDYATLNVRSVEEEKYEEAKREADFGIVVSSVNTVIDTLSYLAYDSAQKQNFVFADFGEESIILSETSGEKVLNEMSIPNDTYSFLNTNYLIQVLNEISIPNDRYRLFINMTDENNGYLLYCGTPAAGLMTKILYVTKDRWKTYHEIDIGSKIDGYPNSLSIAFGGKIYIGTQMRSRGYLFVSEDEGESWETVGVDDESYFRDGYAPLFAKESGKSYLILHTGDEVGDSQEYSLYRAENPVSDNGDSWQPMWEVTGKFLLEGDIEEYFLKEGIIYIRDVYGKQYQIEVVY